MRFLDLGRLEVRDGQSSKMLGRRAARALAALLWADRPMPADRLADIVWGDGQPAGPRESLHVLIWRLRRVLEPSRAQRKAPTLLVLTPSGYVLLTRSRQVDSSVFLELCASARRAPAAAALEQLDAALALWRGHPLGELGHEPWAMPMAAKLVTTYIASLEVRLDAMSELGRYDEVAADAGQLVREHPTREGLWAHQAGALYRLGDHAGALRALHSARVFLVEELGVEPGPKLKELEQKILQHDPALGPAAAVTPSRRRAGRAKQARPQARQSRKPRDDGTIVTVDGEGRALLGELAHDSAYRATQEADGTIVLVPVKRARAASSGGKSA